MSRGTVGMCATFAVLCALGFAAQAHAQDDVTWTIDGAHSHVGFKVRHMMVSWVRGQFTKADGTITFDGSNLKRASAEISIDVTSIDTEVTKRDEHLKSADFFDVENHPTITFRSTKVKPGNNDTFQLVGDLTLKGVTQAVTLDVEGGLTPVSDPWGNTKLGFTATAAIDRQDFGITWNSSLDGGGLVVGDEIHLIIEVELNKDS